MAAEEQAWRTDADRLEDALSELCVMETQRDALRVKVQSSRSREIDNALTDLVNALNRLERLEVAVEVDDVKLSDAVTRHGGVVRWVNGRAHHLNDLTYDPDDQTWCVRYTTRGSRASG